MDSSKDRLQGIRRGTGRLASILAILIAGGCASTKTLTIPEAEQTAMVVPRLAATVAIHYPPEFVNSVQTANIDTLLILRAPLGGPAVSMMNRTLAASFDRVEQLAEWPPRPGDAPDAALVLVPRLDRYSLGRHHETGLFASIRFQLRLHAPTGELLDERDFIGYGTSARRLILPTTQAESATRAALRNASARMLIGLHEHPEVIARLKGRTGQSQPQPLPQAQPSGAAPRFSMVMLTERATREETTDPCFAQAIAEFMPHAPVMPAEQFRDALFPWWEPEIAPADDEQIEKVLKREPVAGRIRELGLRHLLMARLSTSAPELSGPFACGGGPGAGGCFGVATAERRSMATAKVWDLASATQIASLSAETKGTSWVAGFLIPVWRTAPTEKDACRELARQLPGVLRP